MNTTLTTTPGRHDHPPQQQVAQTHPVRRVGLVDRLALHAGVALIKWGRRPLNAESRERLANRYEQQLARQLRERSAERQLHLITSVR